MLRGVCIFYEKLPIWLLSLWSVEVEEVYIPQENYVGTLANSIVNKTIDKDIFDGLISRIGRKKDF